MSNTQNIQKNENAKTTKEATEKTVNSYTELYQEIQNAQSSSDSEYIINLEGNDADYLMTGKLIWSTSVNVKTLTINGNGITIDCHDANELFYINDPEFTLIIKNLTIANGYANRGTIWSSGTIIVNDSTFVKCNSENNQGSEAGAIYIYDGGKLYIHNTVFEDCYSTRGAIMVSSSAEAIITNTTFINNTAKNEGGAIYLAAEEWDGSDYPIAYINDSKFINNTAKYGGGGAIYNNLGHLTIENSQFINNTETGTDAGADDEDYYPGGGAIYTYTYTGSCTHITNSSFINNSATGKNGGGAIFKLSGSDFIIDGSNFTNNNASKGGAISILYGRSSTIKNSLFDNNNANTTAASIYNKARLDISNSNFTKNIGKGSIIENRGTIQLNNSNIMENTYGIITFDNLTVYNTTFTKNKGVDRGTIYIGSGIASIDNSSFIENTQEGEGAAIHNLANVEINNTIFDNNEVTEPDSSAGAVYNEKEANMNITHSKFINNKADFASAIENWGNLNISTIFDSNRGTSSGAIENREILYIYDSTFNNNTVEDGNGGAIYNRKNLTIENSNFTKNYANNGGAIYSVSDSTINLKNTNFTENNATNGGSVQILTNSYKLVGNTFRNNTPENFGLTTNQGRELIEIISTDGNTLNDDYDVTIQIDGTNAGSGIFNNGLMDDYPITETDCLYTFIMTGLYDDSKFRDNTYFYYLPLELSINTTNVTVEYGNTSFDIPVEFNKEVSAGTVRIKIDGSEIGNTTITEETKAVNVSVDITGLEINNYTFTAEYEQDTNLKNTTAILTITKVNTTTNIMEKNNVLGNASIKVNVTNKAGEIVESGFILVYDENNNFLGASPINGEAVTIPLNIKEKGTYTINVTYLGNDIYNPSNNTDTIKVIPETNIEIDILNNTEENVIIKINATEKDGTPLKQQEVNITLPNGTKVTKKTDDNGIITITDTTTKPGNYTTTAAITTSDKYVGTTETDDLTIVPDYQSIIDAMNKTIQDQNKTIQDQNKTIQNQNKTIQDLNKTLQDLNRTSIIRAVAENNTVGNTKVIVTLDNKQANPITNTQITVKNAEGKTIGTGKTDKKGIAVIAVDTPAGTENVTVIYKGNSSYTPSNTTISITTYKINTTVTVEPIEGIIGEKITLVAHIKDSNNNLVSGGNLVFKLNGKTLRTDGRFDSNAPALKLKVNNGIVKYTITADLYLRNAKNLTASYSGSYKYNEAKSDVVTAQIKKRDAKIAVTVTPSKQKQYKTITFTAKLTDTTPNYKNKTMMHTGTKVLFKVNGKTIKDKNGANLLVKVNSNNTASYKYTVPQGMGGVTNDGKVRDYNVEAVLVSDIYYPDTRGTTTFNVERSPITIGISKVTVNSKNQLSVQASIKDYKNNYVIGTNNVNIKINGRSYVNAKTNKTQNFKVSGGKINLSKLQINKDIKIKSVMIVTGARQAYLGQRNETSKIVKV